jgi:MSHA biogenesis protein MshN
MSLINQMLQDLDSRRAASGPNSGLPNEVRPLPPVRRSNAPLMVGVGVAVSVLVGWFMWQQADDRRALAGRATVRVEPPVVTPPPVVPAPLPEAAAVVAPGLPVSAMVPLVPLVAEAAVADTALVGGDEASLRLTTSLQFLPEREPSVAPRAVKPKVPAPEAQSVGTPAAPAAGSLKPAVSAAPAAKASAAVTLEKSVAAGSAHERAEGEYRKAVGALNAGRTSESVESLRAALKQDGAHTASRQLLFKLLIENKRLDEAAELLNEGLQLQPSQISWAMSLGRLQVDRGDLAAAGQTLQRSLAFAANSADYQGFAAHVLQRLGRSKEAAERYQAATRLAPAEGRWWLGLGLALEADGRAAEARDALLRARASGTLNAELNALVDQKLR